MYDFMKETKFHTFTARDDSDDDFSNTQWTRNSEDVNFGERRIRDTQILIHVDVDS